MPDNKALSTISSSSIRNPTGLQVIEALAPLHTRFKYAVKDDYFSIRERELYFEKCKIMSAEMDKRYENWFEDIWNDLEEQQRKATEIWDNIVNRPFKGLND